MNDFAKTLIYVAAAALLFVAAIFTNPGGQEPEVFDDQGEPFFPNFDDPAKAVALEVMEFQPATASVKPFKVQLAGGIWTIPSHDGYPADAKDHMSTAAGLFIGLEKESIRSDNPEDHGAFQVLDPRESSEEGGVGKVVTFSDGSGNELASLIVGKKADETEGRYFVRVPKKKRTYTARIPEEVSTAFKDWIETDLLQLTTWDIVKILFDYYSIDEQLRQRVEGDRILANKPENDWVVEDLADGEEIDKDVMQKVVDTLGKLQIVDVRRKPPGLSAQLTMDDQVEMTQEAASSLRARGFYFTRDGSLFSNEGDLYVSTKKGVVYTLRFGEVLFGVGADQGNGATTDGGPSSNRYLMVTVRFDASLLEKPEGAPLTREQLDLRKQARTGIETIKKAIDDYKTQNESLPSALTDLTAGDSPLLVEIPKDPWDNDFAYVVTGDTFEIVCFGADKAEGGEGSNSDLVSTNLAAEDDLEKVFSDFEAYQQKVEEGEQEVSKLRERFADWYYVIDDESYRSLHVRRDQLVKQGDAAGPPEAPEGDDNSAVPVKPGGG